MSARQSIASLPRSGFARLLVMAIGVRLLLLPLSHTWDTQSWANVFAQLASGPGFLESIRAPYETLRELTLLTQAAGRHTDFYEYWAYPPLMLYIYWPLAHVYTSFNGSPTSWFAAQPAMIAPAFPLPLLAATRVPNIVADVATLSIMRALGTGLGNLRWYAFNPLVLLVGVWTFDPVMVALLLLGLYYAERGRWAAAGLALALGAAAKYVPLVVVPAVMFAILDRDESTRKRLKNLLGLALATATALLVLIWPVGDGVLYALERQGARFGTGLTSQQLWTAFTAQYPPRDWQPTWQAYASAELGNLLLPLVLLVATFAVAYWRPPLHVGFLMLVAAFLAASKVVNEPYALAPLALTTIALERRPTTALWACRHLLWLVPFAFALLNTPAWAFALSPLQQLLPDVRQSLPLWLDGFRDFRAMPEAAVPYALLAVSFDVILGLTAWSALRGSSVSSAPSPTLAHA